jgi:hypothetical protein
MPLGRRVCGPTLNDLIRRDDHVDAEVVLGLGQLVIDELELVHGSDNRGVRSDEPSFGERATSMSEYPAPLPTRTPSRLTATLLQMTRSSGRILSTPIVRAAFAAPGTATHVDVA